MEINELERQTAEWQTLCEAGHDAYVGGKLVVAEEKFLLALKVAEGWSSDEELSKNDEIRARLSKTLNNLGAIYHAQGKYSFAEETYNKSLEIKRALFGEEHVEVAVSLQNLAAVLSARRMFDKAKPLYERALAIKERVHGEMHEELLVALKNYELLLRRLKDKEGADKVAARIKKIEQTEVSI